MISSRGSTFSNRVTLKRFHLIYLYERTPLKNIKNFVNFANHMKAIKGIYYIPGRAELVSTSVVF